MAKFSKLLWIALNVLTVATYSESVTDLLFPGPPCRVHTIMPGNPSPFTSTLEGTCNSMLSCAAFGGVPIGKCPAADVCCAFERTCDQSSSRNHTYFVNPAYPSPFNGTNNCPVTVYKAFPSRICQLRLDFIDFDVHRPINGNCDNDRLIVTGQGANSFIPPICGLNTGQHMYVDIERIDGPFIVRMSTAGRGYRRWNIKITQIECNNPTRAPPNCLQYYIGPVGAITSFNYEISRFGASTAAPTDVAYLNGMDYAICFRKEEGFCSQTYTANSSSPFEIINANQDGSEIVPTNRANAGITRCPNDYLQLGGIRFCGSYLNIAGAGTGTTAVNAPVIDSTRGPFIARFVSDAYQSKRGFHISYQQNPCGVMFPPVTIPATAGG